MGRLRQSIRDFVKTAKSNKEKQDENTFDIADVLTDDQIDSVLRAIVGYPLSGNDVVLVLEEAGRLKLQGVNPANLLHDMNMKLARRDMEIG